MSKVARRFVRIAGATLAVATAVVTTVPASAQIMQLVPLVPQLVDPVPPLLIPQPPPVYSQGSFRLLPTARVDVDDGSFGFNGLDLRYQGGALSPVGDAGLHYAPGIAPGFFGCVGINYFQTASVPISALSVGDRLCMATDSGRRAQLRIDAIDPILRSVRISYTTWQ